MHRHEWRVPLANPPRRRREADADQRDAVADWRDAAATLRDQITAQRDAEAGSSGEKPDRGRALGLELLMNAARDRERLAAVRARAATQREAAAQDRRHAAEDRRRAALDRQAAAEAIARHRTGAPGRQVGLAAMQREVGGTQPTEECLVAAVIDGDEPLRLFACTISARAMPFVRDRFSAITDELARAFPGATISVGLAEREPGEPLDHLVARADAMLRASEDDYRG